MSGYADEAAAGFERSRAVFDAVVAELADPECAQVTHAELEERLTERSRELMRQLFQDHVGCPTQATYDGHPLYTYAGDTAPGLAKGNGLNASGRSVVRDDRFRCHPSGQHQHQRRRRVLISSSPHLPSRKASKPGNTKPAADRHIAFQAQSDRRVLRSWIIRETNVHRADRPGHARRLWPGRGFCGRRAGAMQRHGLRRRGPCRSQRGGRRDARAQARPGCRPSS